MSPAPDGSARSPTRLSGPPSSDPPLESLAGLVERVTFHSPESGFCVLRVKVRGERDLVTIVGQTAMISAGEWVTVSGHWANDANHGLQFRAKFLKTSEPCLMGADPGHTGHDEMAPPVARWPRSGRRHESGLRSLEGPCEPGHGAGVALDDQ